MICKTCYKLVKYCDCNKLYIVDIPENELSALKAELNFMKESNNFLVEENKKLKYELASSNLTLSVYKREYIELQLAKEVICNNFDKNNEFHQEIQYKLKTEIGFLKTNNAKCWDKINSLLQENLKLRLENETLIPQIKGTHKFYAERHAAYQKQIKELKEENEKLKSNYKILQEHFFTYAVSLEDINWANILG